MLATIWKHNELIKQLLRQEILKEYREALLGFLWAVLAPLFDLLIYTFVFSLLFKVRVSPPEGVNVVLPYGLVLLAGLMPHQILSQALSAAPNDIVKNTNYVKKVRFPLEVLPVVTLGVSMFHGLVGLGVLLVGVVIMTHVLPWTIILLPFAFVPLVLLTVGLCWLLASLGVYFRDLQNMVVVFLRLWFFATPIVYPVSRLPARIRPWIALNPLTFIVEATRDVLLWGRVFSWETLGIWTLVTALIAWLGYFWFIKTKQGFADVL